MTVPKGWKIWKKLPVGELGIVLVMFMESKIFPKGAIVQGSIDEIKCGVIGDKKPTFYKLI